MKHLYLLSLLCGSIGFSQELPQIVPPSPRAETFHIYGDIPVAHNTGVPDISIPLYTIESDGITVPIVLRYHTASIKPGTDKSNMAFGWTLDVGGRISRTVNQWPDEYVPRPETFKLTNDLNPLDDDDAFYLYQASGNNGPYFDTKHDMFSYSALNEHGKFILNNQENGTGGTDISIHELIESPKTISLSMAYNSDFPAAGSDDSIDYFKIVNGGGQTYYFGENKNYEVVESGSDWGRSPSSWLLTRAISADKSTTVDFTYETVPTYFLSSNSWADKVSSSPKDYEQSLHFNFGLLGGIANCFLEDIIDNGISYEVKTIKEITFNEGKVVFNLSTDKKRINSIEVRDSNNQLIKSISFTRSYFYDAEFPNQTAYESLDQVEINNHNDSPVQTYAFEYYDYGQPREDETDFWGYFNGRNNYTYEREIINRRNDIGGAAFTCQTASHEKNASLLHSRSYVLHKITYPTRGSTEFDYGLHQFIDLISYSPDVNGTIIGGGLRVESITNNPADGSPEIIKTYHYTPRSFGYKNPKSPFDPYNYTRTNYYVGGFGVPTSRFRNRTFSHNFNSESLDTQINYEVVTEYQGGALLNSNTGKTVYTYEYGMENEYWHKTVIDPSYGFDFGIDLRNQEGLGMNKLIYYYGASGGKLKTTEYFRNDGNSYTPIKKITNDYSYRDIINSFSSLNVVLVCSYADVVVNGDPGNYYDQFLQRRTNVDLNVYTNPSRALPVMGSYDSFICQSSANLIQQEVTEFRDNGAQITSITEYDYKNNNLVKEQSFTNSKGETQIVKTIYPDDIDTASTLIDNSALTGGNLTTTAYNAVVDMTAVTNQVAAPIQTETYLDIDDDGLAESNELLSLQRTNYRDWGSDLILPENIETLKGIYNASTNPLEDRIVHHDYYPDGNVKEISKADGSHMYYVWGYNEEYPIVKLENFESSQITMAVQNLINAAVTASDNDYSTANENALRTALSNLRNSTALSDAMVTTYTYDPLVGVTSMTDPKGYTVYYIYDDFNRLKEVRDAEDNLVTDYLYHYKGQ